MLPAAETARTDRIGKGFVPQIQPLSGVLAKILQRKQEAIDRCCPAAGPLHAACGASKTR